ncbi:MAG: hypothetical protein K9I85_04505 [Saprospiraceae bacterium]|nr:hypothetical protein [Saprospiraceae bacterium]
MITLSAQRRTVTKSTLFLLAMPLGIVFFLFFIDEGFYDLRWMKAPGNWVAFGLYWMAMILGEFFISLFLPRRWPARQKIWLIFCLGIPLGILLVLVFLRAVTGYSF